MSNSLPVTQVTVAEEDPSKWWAGTKYDVRFHIAESGWSSPCAATFVLDISDHEETSPGSASPWSGWLGWCGDVFVIAWLNPEIGASGATKVPRSLDIDEQPTNQQWEALGRLVITMCLDSEDA